MKTVCFFIISWQLQKPVLHKNEEDRESAEHTKDNHTDGKTPTLDVELELKEDEREFHSHTGVSWEQPRRSVNQLCLFVFFIYIHFLSSTCDAFLSSRCQRVLKEIQGC